MGTPSSKPVVGTSKFLSVKADAPSCLKMKIKLVVFVIVAD
jgi:hypothetical protein